MHKFLPLIPVLFLGLVACDGGAKDGNKDPNGTGPLTVPDIQKAFTGNFQAKITNCPRAVNNKPNKKDSVISIPDGTILYGGGILTIRQTEEIWSTTTLTPLSSDKANFHASLETFPIQNGVQVNSGVHSYFTINNAIIDADGNFPEAQNKGVFDHSIYLIKDVNNISDEKADITGQFKDGKLTINFESPLNSVGCRIKGTLIAYRSTAQYTDSIKTAICKNLPTDSTTNGQTASRIQSHTIGNPVYNSIVSRSLANGTKVNIDYMFHPSAGLKARLDAKGEPVRDLNNNPIFDPIPNKGLIVLLPGGNGDAKIAGTLGSTPTASGDNFLIRSAHLFAAQAYDVVSINRPSDTTAIIDGVDFDSYRNSMRHAVDISKVINAVKTATLPVFIAGTNRGAISAIANNTLASAVMISSPVTTGAGTPLDITDLSTSSLVSQAQNPTHVSFNSDDACTISTPPDSLSLADKLLRNNVNVILTTITGGFDNTDPNLLTSCQAQKLHGFFGIESCAVSRQTNYAQNIINKIALLNNSLPIANSDILNNSVSAGASTTFNLTSFNGLANLVSDTDAGETFTFSTPFSTTSLGGDISVTPAGVVTYTAPANITTNTQDSFVYVVNDSVKGEDYFIIKTGTANNVISINLVP